MSVSLPNPGSPAPSERPAIDAAALDALRELGGRDEPGLLRELIAIYLEDAPQRLAEIRSALERGDLELLERASHTLKSSSANIGARTLSDCCQRIEATARRRKSEGLDELCAAAEAHWNAVASALREVRA